MFLSNAVHENVQARDYLCMNKIDEKCLQIFQNEQLSASENYNDTIGHIIEFIASYVKVKPSKMFEHYRPFLYWLCESLKYDVDFTSTALQAIRDILYQAELLEVETIFDFNMVVNKIID